MITVFLTGFAPRARAANVTVLVKPGVPMYRPGQKKVHGMLEFPTIQNALDHAPQPTNGGRVVIRITPGVYHERIWVALGRPWRDYSRVIYLNTYMPKGISPEGFSKWGRSQNYKTTFYTEAGSRGPGADPAARAPWERKLTAAESEGFQPQNFLRGSDDWNPVAEAAKLP